MGITTKWYSPMLYWTIVVIFGSVVKKLGMQGIKTTLN